MEKIIKKISKYDSDKLLEYFNSVSLNDLHKLKLYADDKYYNTGESSGLDDWQYDMLKDFLQEKDPNYVPPIGAKLRSGENRVDLPFWLGSMDKISVSFDIKQTFKDSVGGSEEQWNEIKDDDAEIEKLKDIALEKYTRELNNWLKDNKSSEYIIESKLDGVSCLLLSENGNIKLYTRGDGVAGADISYLAPYFKTIPKNLTANIAVRGELIMDKSMFADKYADEYANPRNMVSGRIGGKTARKGLEDIEFIAYEIVGGDIEKPKPTTQLSTLTKLGFKVVDHEIIKKISINELLELFTKFYENSDYEIDGIIVQPNKKYERNISGNPDYAFAFKMRMADNIVEATVKEVLWNTSKRGMLKPRVRIEPVNLRGVTITYATGFNAKFIRDNNIGPGAVINITRSGDVIPFIVDVVTEAAEPQFPTDISYKWNDTEVDIITTERGDIICIKIITSFFAQLGIKFVSEATVSKMYNYGLDNVIKILSATKDDLMNIEGIQEKSAERIVQNIHDGLQDVSIGTVLGASGIFGPNIGVKRVELIFDSIPNFAKLIPKLSKEEIKSKIIEIEGFSDITASQIANHAKWVPIFLLKIKPYVTFKKKIRVSNNLQGYKIVFSGFRDKEMEKQIELNGGKVTGSVTGNTSAVIVQNKGGKLTGKPLKAQELGVPVYSKEEFIEEFLR